MKKYFTILIIMLVSLVGVSCVSASSPAQEPVTQPQVLSGKQEAPDKGIRAASINNDELHSFNSGALNQTEADGLVFMREEEKLAHDLYLAFYEQWGLPIFQNIASSEQEHMNAVEAIFVTYDLSDPAASNPAGIFTNPALQALYDQLLAQGSQSLGDALKAGASVEEIDILDLRKRLSQTGKVDIARVYENLETGSNNHLRSFVSILKNQTGEVYQPGYLPTEDYLKIVSGVSETGGQGQPGGNGRGGLRN